MSGLTAVSLFAGVGGIDLALERAGVSVVAAVEIDPDCRSVLARHFPAARLFNDVTEVTGDDLLAAGFVPGRGILAGGWPCQGNSVAGGRGGMGDPRSGLWRQLVRLLAETRPRWFLGENVPGLLSVNGGRDIAVVRRDLAQLGYWWAERILDSQYFGVPQRRRRVFFAGCAGDRAAPVQVLLEPESGAGHPAARKEARQGTPGSAERNADNPGVTGTLTTGMLGDYDDTLRAEGGGGTDQGGHLVVAPTITAGWGTNHGSPGNGGKDEACLAVTAATLQGGGRRGHRVDAEGAAGGHLILAQNGSDIQVGDQPGALTAGMARQTSGDLIAYDLAQITSGANRANPAPGDPAPTLNGSGQTHVADTAYALTSRASRASRASREETYVTHALTSEGADASEDGTGRGTPLVVAATLTSGRSNSEGVNPPGRRQEDDVNLVPMAFNPQSGGSAARLGYGATPTALQASQVTAVQPAAAAAVRRLTPLECERLQGLPDNWTRYRADGTEQSDSARYRQVGNSVAVPVVEWIVRRIVAAEAVS